MIFRQFCSFLFMKSNPKWTSESNFAHNSKRWIPPVLAAINLSHKIWLNNFCSQHVSKTLLVKLYESNYVYCFWQITVFAIRKSQFIWKEPNIQYNYHYKEELITQIVMIFYLSVLCSDNYTCKMLYVWTCICLNRNSMFRNILYHNC